MTTISKPHQPIGGSARRVLHTPEGSKPRAARPGICRLGAVGIALILLVSACSGGQDGDAMSTPVFTDESEDYASADTEDGFDDMSTAAVVAEDRPDSAMSSDSAMSDADSSLDSGDSMSEEADDGFVVSQSDRNAELASGSQTTLDRQANTVADIGRDIIYTAELTVETSDVTAASSQAARIVDRLGGFTFGQQTSTRDHIFTSLTFKVLPGQFVSALDQLSALGELVDQSVSAEDVTGAILDLNSRITTAAVSVDRLRDFLKGADTLKGVIDLERELGARETSLEQLRGRLRSLRDRVGLATITLTIRETAEAVPETSVSLRMWTAAGEDDPCLGVVNLTLEPRGTVGFCFELENHGETTLTDLTLRSDALRFAMSELSVQEGTNINRIEPGDRVVATITEQVADGRVAGRVATRGLDVDVRLRAQPITDDGIAGSQIVRSAEVFVDVLEDDAAPGFLDALRGGWNTLLSIGSALALAVGALLPFVPVIVVALIPAWWWLRRRPAQPAAEAGPAEAGSENRTEATAPDATDDAAEDASESSPEQASDDAPEAAAKSRLRHITDGLGLTSDD